MNNKILKIIIKQKFNQNLKVRHLIMENKIVYKIKMMKYKINNKIIKNHIQLQRVQECQYFRINKIKLLAIILNKAKIL
jgi:hypothetical protein